MIKIAFMDKAMNSRGHWYVFDDVLTNHFSYISAFVQKTCESFNWDSTWFSIAWNNSMLASNKLVMYKPGITRS